MHFKNVVIHALAAIDPPHRLSSAEICQRLAPTLERLGMRPNLLEEISGIRYRRVWDADTLPSDAATAAAEAVIARAGLDRDRIGVLINTSVCRDYLEPSTACIVHGNLGLAADCLNFDIGNACLAFMNGMDVAARMLERGDIEYALVVDGESSGPITQATIERLQNPDVDEHTFRAQFASLTLGSGSVAMLMTRHELVPEGHRYTGSVTRSATRLNQLCRGQMEWMETDTQTLLEEGLKLAAKTFEAAAKAMNWTAGALDQIIIHQVSRVHTDSIVELLQLQADRVHAIYPEMGNVGPASVPMTLARAAEMNAIKPGDRVALMGIGSGLNCAMAEVLW